MILKKSKNGQAAFEFVMTYGWAILGFLIVIGVITFMMPKSSSILPEKCTFNSATPCSGAEFSTNLKLAIRNNIGSTMYNVSANLTGSLCYIISNQTNTVSEGDTFNVICSNSGTLNLTKDSKFKVSVTYKKKGGGFDQVSQGEVYGKYDSCTQNLRFRDYNGASAMDNVNDKACCPNANDCVSDLVCYRSGVGALVARPSWGVGTYTCGSASPGNWT